MDQVNATPAPKRAPWNKGNLTGAKPPLGPKHVWSIRTKLQIEGRAHDLAMFNLATDSKLRGCDVVAIRVEDVAAGDYYARLVSEWIGGVGLGPRLFGTHLLRRKGYPDLSPDGKSQGRPVLARAYQD